MVTLHYRGKQLRIQRCSYYTRDLIHLTFTWEESKEIRKPNSEFIHMSRSFWLNIFKLNLWREAWVWVLFCELVVELSKVGHHRKFVRTKKRTFQEYQCFSELLLRKSQGFSELFFGWDLAWTLEPSPRHREELESQVLFQPLRRQEHNFWGCDWH